MADRTVYVIFQEGGRVYFRTSGDPVELRRRYSPLDRFKTASDAINAVSPSSSEIATPTKLSPGLFSLFITKRPSKKTTPSSETYRESEGNDTTGSSAKDTLKEKTGVDNQRKNREIIAAGKEVGAVPNTPGKQQGVLALIGNAIEVSLSSYIGIKKAGGVLPSVFTTGAIGGLDRFSSVILEQARLEGNEDLAEAILANAIERNSEALMEIWARAEGDLNRYKTTYKKAQPNENRLRIRDTLYTYMGRKIEFPALITVTKKDVVSKEADLEEKVEEASTDHFLLQGVAMPDTEKFQIIETFGEPTVLFFDRRARIYQFSGTLLNAKNVLWRDEFYHIYDQYLRGTKIAENNYRMLLTFDEIMLEGALLNLQIGQQSDQPMGVSMSFQMYIVRHTVLNLEQIKVANDRAEEAANSNKQNAYDNRLNLIDQQVFALEQEGEELPPGLGVS